MAPMYLCFIMASQSNTPFLTSYFPSLRVGLSVRLIARTSSPMHALGFMPGGPPHFGLSQSCSPLESLSREVVLCLKPWGGREVGRKARKMRSVTAVHLSHARGVNEERNFKQASWCAGAVGSWRKRCSARVGTRRPGCGNGRLSYPRVTTCAGFDPWVRNCGLKKAFQVFE